MILHKSGTLYVDGYAVSGNFSVKQDAKGLFHFTVADLGTAETFGKFNVENIRNLKKLKMPASLDWTLSIDSLTIFTVDDEFFVAYSYNLKALVREIDNLLNYYGQLFRFVEIFRDKNDSYRITGLKVKPLEELEFQRLNKGFSVVFRISDFNGQIANLIDDHLALLKTWHYEIVDNLSSASRSTFQTLFAFPEELKTSCEQYLLYFAGFLKDLGISATSSLEEGAGKVLFSVTPIDDKEALDRIREALAIYLNLPSSPIVYDGSFAAMRLQQQIENLHHAQKMVVREMQLGEQVIQLQSETIQEKNLIISQKDSLIKQQSQIIEKITSKSVMMDSLENKEDIEQLYDGLKVGESKFLKDQLGIQLNPAKLIKTAVKNTFGKDDFRKSILGLDEDAE